MEPGKRRTAFPARRDLSHQMQAMAARALQENGPKGHGRPMIALTATKISAPVRFAVCSAHREGSPSSSIRHRARQPSSRCVRRLMRSGVFPMEGRAFFGRHRSQTAGNR